MAATVAPEDLLAIVLVPGAAVVLPARWAPDLSVDQVEVLADLSALSLASADPCPEGAEVSPSALQLASYGWQVGLELEVMAWVLGIGPVRLAEGLTALWAA